MFINKIFFCGLQDNTYSAVCFFFFMITCVEFQVRIMLYARTLILCCVAYQTGDNSELQTVIL
jgi:hypothetical protein